MLKIKTYRIGIHTNGITNFFKSLVSVPKQIKKSITKRFFEAEHKLDPIEVTYANRDAVKIEEEDAIFWWILSCYRGKYRRIDTVRNMSHNTAPSAWRSVV